MLGARRLSSLMLHRFLSVAVLSLCGASGAFAAEPAMATLKPMPARALPALEKLAGREAAQLVVALEKARGQPVIVNFWASWCEPCLAEMPALQRLAQAHGDKLSLLAVNFKENAARAERFAKAAAVTFPVLLDPAGDIARAWEVRIFPTTVLIAADGRPRWRIRGEWDWSGPQADRLMRSLLP